MPSPTEIAAAEEEFTKAFDELQLPTGTAPATTTPAAPDVTDVVAKGEAAPAAAAPATGDAGAAAPAGTAPAESTPAAAAPAVPEATAPANTVPVVDPTVATLQAEIAALKAAQAAAPAPAPAPAAEPDPAAAPVYTEAETAAIAKYKEDWPDIQAGEALVRRQEYRELVSYVFAQVRQELAPLQAFTQTQSGRTQYGDLIALVPDYDEVRDKTLEWINTQPPYLKTAYQAVADSGTPADVADLITRFKKETGYVAPAQSTPAAPAAAAPAAAAPAAKPAPAKSGAALPAAAAAAAANLRVVKSGRTEPGTAAADPNDFDAAFAEFTKVK